MAASDARSPLRARLLEGLVVPAHPLALTAERGEGGESEGRDRQTVDGDRRGERCVR